MKRESLASRPAVGKRRHGFSLAIAAVALALNGCDSPPPEAPKPPDVSSSAAPTAPSQPRLQTFAYDCVINGYVVADFRQSSDSMWLFLKNNTVLLPQEQSASGGKYSNGDVTFWSKGSEAMLTVAGEQDHCLENRPASVVEDAKLRGVDFRATGNEPGWTLEITGTDIVLVTNYGQDRFEYQAANHATGEDGRTVTYASSDPAVPVTTTITGETCADDMSGQRYETRVEITVGEKAYRGCGQGLH